MWSVHCGMASNEEIVQLLVIFENSSFNVLEGKLKKMWCVHPINKKRKTLGECHHLILQLSKDDERFFLMYPNINPNISFSY